MIECIETGLVYRNPKPHLRAIHAWHPSIVRLDNGEMLCAFDLGEAVESLDYRTYLARSVNGGKTWTAPTRLFEDDSPARSTHTCRISRTRSGTLMGLGARFYRENEEEGLTNRANLGLVPMDLILLKSLDSGKHWERPRTIKPPLDGPGFEVCHSIIELPDGRWLAPMATWKGWNGEAPNGVKAIALVSHDRGATWPEHIDVMDAWKEGIIHFEQSMVSLPDGRLLAIAWAFHEPSGQSRPTPYAISSDGRRFSSPRPTGLRGQTAKITVLPDGRIFCLYRRDDQPGLWANVSRLEGDRWINLDEVPMWQGAGSGMTGRSTGSDELSSLKFGFPNMTVLPTGEVFGVFWCCEDGIYNIRWLKIRA